MIRLRPSEPGGRILLVDADDASREELSALLGEIVNDRVVALPTIAGALAALTSPDDETAGPLEVVLLDLALWSAGGAELCEEIRRLDGVAPVPIVGLVAEDCEPLVDPALIAGVTDLLYRPVRPRELAARVHSAVMARRERTELSRRERRLMERSQELLDTNRHLERLVCVDPLTGLANRRHVGAILSAEWRRASRTRLHMSVLVIDLDQFHTFNESHGHLGGDECLRRVSDALASELRRPSDLLGRYGGEEFLAILPDTNAEGALAVAERLRAAVERLEIPHPRSDHRLVTISIGAASVDPKPESDPNVLVADADRAMFRAKRAGRNQVALSGPRPSRRRSNRRAADGSDRWPAPVWMDPIFADRLPGALERMRSLAHRINDAVGATETESARALVREIRSAAAEYGLEHVEGLATSLDDSIFHADECATAAALDELRWYLERVPVIYRQRVAEWRITRVN